MRTATLAIMATATSLLVSEVIAAPRSHAHVKFHADAKRDYYLDTDHVIVIEEIRVVEMADGSLHAGVPVAIGTSTIDGAPILVTEPTPVPTIASTEAKGEAKQTQTPSPNSSLVPVSAAVFLAAKPSPSPLSVGIFEAANPKPSSSAAPEPLSVGSFEDLKPKPSSSLAPVPIPAAVFEDTKPSSTLAPLPIPAAVFNGPSSISTSIPVATNANAIPLVAPFLDAASKAIGILNIPSPTTLSSIFVAPSTSTSAIPLATKPVVASFSSSGKRGAAYNDVSLLSALSPSSQVSWSYNWGSTTPVGVPSSMEFVPMLWGLASQHTSNWDSAVASAKAAGSQHLLYVNEPDHTEQANLSPSDAAAGYMKFFQPLAGQFKLVGPAVTNGGGSMGLTWLENFMAACVECQIDAQAVHWYNGGDAAAFKEHMSNAYAAGGNRPLWVTEFQASGSQEEQTAFLDEVMAWMDETSWIERYAYFGVFDGNLVAGKALSFLGKAYAALT